MKLRLALMLFIFMVSTRLLAQNKLNNKQQDTTRYTLKKELQKTRDSSTYYLNMAKAFALENKVDSIEYYLCKLRPDKLTNQQKVAYYSIEGRLTQSIRSYNKAFYFARKHGDIKQINRIRYNVFNICLKNSSHSSQCIKHLDTLHKEALKYKDTTGQILVAHGIFTCTTKGLKVFDSIPNVSDTVEKHLHRGYKLASIIQDYKYQKTMLTSLAFYYMNHKNNDRLAEKWNNKLITLAINEGDNDLLYKAYLFMGSIFIQRKNHLKSNKWFQKADRLNLEPKEYILSKRSGLYAQIARNFKRLELLDSCAKYYEKAIKYLKLRKYPKTEDYWKHNYLQRDGQMNRMFEIATLNEKLKERNQKIIVLLAILLLLLLVSGVLIININKRKRKIAEQQQQLEKQKVKQLVQEQEIQAIDAMISGQEKERQRLATGLHDDLGSLLATLKLYVTHLAEQLKQGPLENHITTTNQLLEETCQKVRGMAHARNTGVVAKYGLIPAVQKFTAKISATQQLQIEVVYNDFTDRLENTMELSIFRMIQELITNVIKHANATKVHLELVRHQDFINILVVDNGIGFNPKTSPQKNSMGLYAIKNRVKVNDGFIDIDSLKGHGTTISIDLPLAKSKNPDII